jgi:hypothetical protein
MLISGGAMNESRARLWEIADKLRERHLRVELPELLDEAQRAGLRVTREDVDLLLRAERRSDDGEFCVPRGAREFIEAMAKWLKPRVVINPFAGYGELIEYVARIAEPEHSLAIERSQRAVSVGAYLTAELPISWLCEEPSRAIENPVVKNSAPDLVVSCLPFGGKPESRSLVLPIIGPVDIRDSLSHVALLEYAGLLTENGTAVFVTTNKFLFDQHPASLRHVLRGASLHVSAALTLPPGQLRPWTGMPAMLVVVSRRDPGKVFLGELIQGEGRPELLAKNLQSGKEGSAPQLGVFVDPEDMQPIESIVASREIERLAKRTACPKRLLGDMASIHVPTRDGQPFPESQNELYFPLVGVGPVRTEPPEKTTRNWAQVSLRADVALRDYVAGYFDTRLGQRVRAASLTGTSIPRLSRGDLASLELYLPDLSSQSQMLEIGSQLLVLEGDLARQRQRLWEAPGNLPEVARQLRRVRPDDFQQWIDSLPVPLATVLQAYHSRSAVSERLASLFNFFEALTEFHAVLLLSGLSAEPAYFLAKREDLLGSLQERQRYLKEPGVGSWLIVAARCARLVRELLSSPASDENDSSGPKHGREDVVRWFGQANPEWLEALTSKVLYNEVLETARKRRNDWKGHGGAVGDAMERALVAELAVLLDRVRDLVGDAWGEVTLVNPKHSRYGSGLYHTTAELLTGTRVPFKEGVVETLAALEDGLLHVAFPASKLSLKVLPLVRMMPSPKAANTTCYFFNRLRDGEARYVSYYYELESEAPVEIKSDDIVSEALAFLGIGESTEAGPTHIK